ncbi:hypothetical protein RND81_10G171500 [Saponaria officinalis]|uniref:Sulfotransferase n=1 Tax=Saponaria officinalis TaxID=3572 RepID=A0AAW1I4R7_SAPOF
MTSPLTKMNQNPKEMETQVSEEDVEELIKSLPKTHWLGSNECQLIQYQGFWCEDFLIRNTIMFQYNFIARDTDILITSLPKTGTTWLKSLLYAVVNRHNTPITQSTLLDHNPHHLIPGLEFDNHTKGSNHLDQLSDPRLLSTHLPYASLPQNIRSSKTKILHITRNPSDMLVSQYYFAMTVKKKLNEDFKPPQFEQFFDEFCEGRFFYGPYFENVLEYWNISIEQPEKVLFLKYEQLKANPTHHLKRLAEFIGMPFSTQEETDGVVNDIIELCSFKNIKELEVNKSGTTLNNIIDTKTFFRKGEVGDWTNHFTPLMVEKMDQLMQDRLKGTSLSFDFLP